MRKCIRLPYCSAYIPPVEFNHKSVPGPGPGQDQVPGTARTWPRHFLMKIAESSLKWVHMARYGFISILFFCLHQPHRPAQRRKTGLGVIGDEPCRLNRTTQALGEPVEVNHLRRTIHRVPRGSHPPDRPGGLTLPLRPSASHHCQRILVRQLSVD